jgi:TRAP-type mannitol/chloroaromatic compound transport system permease large subunit
MMGLSPFAVCVIVLMVLALIGLPIALSMIAASIAYLLLAGLDPATVAEQILNGLYNSYVLLAVPLFILAADLMNTGSLTDRLLRFCLMLVGRPAAAWATSTSSPMSSSPACRARRSRTPWASAGSSSA